MPSSYEQVGTDPLRWETHGWTPFRIARVMLLIGVVGLGLSFAASPVLVGLGEDMFAVPGVGLILFGITGLVGAHRLSMEHASLPVIVTQPRVLEITGAEQGRPRVRADRRTFFVDEARRVELHQMYVGEHETRFAVGIVFGSAVVELQFDDPSTAQHLAEALGRHLGGLEVLAKKRPLVPASIGLVGCLTVLLFLAIVPAGVWPILEGGDPSVTGLVAASIAASCGLVYAVGRTTSKATIVRTVQQYYGRAKE